MSRWERLRSHARFAFRRLLQRYPFSPDGQGRGAPAGTARAHGLFPMAQTCCGQMHYNTGYQREVVPLVRHFVDVFRDAEVVVSPSASCVGMVHEVYPRVAAWPRTIAGAGRRELDPAGLRVFDVPGAQARRRGRRGVLPAPGHLSPDLPLATGARNRRRAPAAVAARCAGLIWWSCPTPTSAAASAARSR